MRSFLIGCSLALWLASSALAQDHKAWIFTGDPRFDAALGRATTSGAVTTLLKGSTLYGPPSGFAVDLDNRSYAITDPAAGGLLIVDGKGTVIRSIGLPVGHRAHDVVLNARGDYAVLSWTSGAGGILEVDRQTHAVKTLWFGSQLAGARGFVRDVDTGDFIALKGIFVDLFRIAQDGSSISSIATIAIGETFQVTQDPGTGAFMSLVFPYPPTSSGVLYAVSPRAAVSVLTTTVIGSTAAADRATSRDPRVALSTYGRLEFYSHHTRTVTPFAKLNNVASHLQPEGSRNVATEARAPGQWVVRLDFPGEPKRAYAAAISFAGIRPGLRLADGRRILINPDVFTMASLLGLLAPYFRGAIGVLDGQGRGQAVLDVSGLPAVRGVSTWIQAVTIDSRAPLGLATIADPVQLTL